MSDLRIRYDEMMVGAGHPTLTDTLNRLGLVEHNNDGTHSKLTQVTDPYIDVRAYGATGDGSTDDTTAIQAALNAIGSGATKRLFFPDGVYRVSGLTPPSGAIEIAGNSLNNTVIRYMGVGGTGTSILDFSGATINRVSIKDMRIEGVDNTNSTVCEHLIKIADVDWGFTIERVLLRACYGNGIHQTGSSNGVMHFYVTEVRWDGIGGYPISFEGLNNAGDRNIHIDNFYVDNTTNITSIPNCQTILSTFEVGGSPVYNGTNWGKGFIYTAKGDGMKIHLQDGRIEHNHHLITTGSEVYPAVVFYTPQAINGTAPTARCHLVLQNVSAIARQDGDYTAYMPPVVLSESGKIYIETQGLRALNCSYLAYYPNEAALADRWIGRQPYGVPVIQEAVDFGGTNRGFYLNGIKVDVFDNQTSLSNSMQKFKKGDLLIFRDAGSSTGNNVNMGWVTGPANGYGIFKTGDSTTYVTDTADAVNVSVSQTVITVPRSRLQNSGTPQTSVAPLDAIVLEGAGTAGANLSTYITAVDYVNSQITINDAVITAVNRIRISREPVTWMYMSGGLGTSAPASGAHLIGERFWNTNPSEQGTGGSKYVITGWICTASGSPGTWHEMRTLTGN